MKIERNEAIIRLIKRNINENRNAMKKYEGKVGVIQLIDRP